MPAGIANRVAAIFLAILKIYMYLIALGLAPFSFRAPLSPWEN